MTAVRLHDTRDPMEAGEKLYRRLRKGKAVEIVTDRPTLVHAMYEAADDLGNVWGILADRAGTMLDCTDNVAGRDLLRAREDAARTLDAAYTLLALICETTPGVRQAERNERRDVAGTDDGEKA